MSNYSEFTRMKQLIDSNLGLNVRILLNPSEDINNYSNESTEIDCTEWEIKEEIYRLVLSLKNNHQLSDEEKILILYEALSKSYVYDDNALTYLKKVSSEGKSKDPKFWVPEQYGKYVDEEWKNRRKEHNRRVCLEISRATAKAYQLLFDNGEKYNISVFLNGDILHYFVGLICDKYCITLDIDDFNNIKDMTRIKTGLTAEGIVIIRDTNDKFRNSLEEFNRTRYKTATQKIDEALMSSDFRRCNSENTEEPEKITYLRNVINILLEEDIDTAGLFEYIKEIVDNYIGSSAREKVWKRLITPRKETIYTRCLIINLQGKKYIIDVDEKYIREFNESEFYEKDTVFIPYKKLSRDIDEEPYYGS